MLDHSSLYLVNITKCHYQLKKAKPRADIQVSRRPGVFHGPRRTALVREGMGRRFILAVGKKRDGERAAMAAIQNVKKWLKT